MSDELAFNSKIDLWLLIVMLGAVSICLWIIVDNWNAAPQYGALITALVGLALFVGIAFPLWILVSMRYFLSDRHLRIRCGPFQWRVPIGEITSVERTNSALSSPALSLDRLRIEYGEGRAVLISPEPREEFLRQLEHRRREAA